MATERVLIVVKTYPTFSKKYDELVCTAGVRPDGSWVRLYPIPFRKIPYENQYKKFQWLEAELERNKDDFRPETYRIKNYNAITLGKKISTGKDGTWAERRELLLKNVYNNKYQLIEDAYNPKICRSLAVFKPKQITNFIINDAEDKEWNKDKLERIKAKNQQIDLFSGIPDVFHVVKKLPYTFSYEFIDIDDQESTLQIIDWEIGALYWNSLKRRNGNEEAACMDVRKKYMEDFAHTKDIHLIWVQQKHFMRDELIIHL